MFIRKTTPAMIALAGIALAPRVTSAQQQPRTVQLSLDEALKFAEGRSDAVAVARAGLSRATGNKYIARSQALPQLSGTAGYTKTLKSQFDIFANSAPPDPTAPKALCAPQVSATATQAER